MRVVIEKQGMEYSRQVKNLRIRGEAGLRSRYVIVMPPAQSIVYPDLSIFPPAVFSRRGSISSI